VTLKFPDLSHHNAPISVVGAPAVIAKATEGASFKDPAYSGFRDRASALKIPFMGYHWVNTDSIASQAGNAHTVMGTTPCMWDAEAAGVTVPRLVDLTKQYRALGGVVHMVYLPHWWWFDHMGSPDLSPLAALDLHLVSSNYTAYSDFGIGWSPYGGMTPVQWQYSDNVSFNGKPVDFNAFKGTAEQYQALISGGIVALTKADVDAIVNGMFAHVVNAVSQGYSQPFEEHVKWIHQNNLDIGALNVKLDRIIALLAAGGGNGLTAKQVQDIADARIASSTVTPPTP
jgi:glycosyl hydrolase family 25